MRGMFREKSNCTWKTKNIDKNHMYLSSSFFLRLICVYCLKKAKLSLSKHLTQELLSVK